MPLQCADSATTSRPSSSPQKEASRPLASSHSDAQAPSPQPALILFVSVGLLFLDVSYAQKRTVVTFIAWLLSLSIIVSRFIGVVTCQYCISFRGGIVFRCMDGPDRLAFTRSPVDGHLGVPTSRGLCGVSVILIVLPQVDRFVRAALLSSLY